MSAERPAAGGPEQAPADNSGPPEPDVTITADAEPTPAIVYHRTDPDQHGVDDDQHRCGPPGRDPGVHPAERPAGKHAVPDGERHTAARRGAAVRRVAGRAAGAGGGRGAGPAVAGGGTAPSPHRPSALGGRIVDTVTASSGRPDLALVVRESQLRDPCLGLVLAAVRSEHRNVWSGGDASSCVPLAVPTPSTPPPPLPSKPKRCPAGPRGRAAWPGCGCSWQARDVWPCPAPLEVRCAARASPTPPWRRGDRRRADQVVAWCQARSATTPAIAPWAGPPAASHRPGASVVGQGRASALGEGGPALPCHAGAWSTPSPWSGLPRSDRKSVV